MFYNRLVTAPAVYYSSSKNFIYPVVMKVFYLPTSIKLNIIDALRTSLAFIFR